MAQLIAADMVRNWMPPRPADSHKGTFGHLLCLCGSSEMPGAAVLSVEAALRSGVGLCTFGGTKDVCASVSHHCPEAILSILEGCGRQEKLRADLNKCTAVLIGPGLSREEEAVQLVETVLSLCPVPLVIDADGINIVARNINILEKASCPVILTPHPGEMARLVKTTVPQVQAGRECWAGELAKRLGVTVVLKGAGTVVASPKGEMLINSTGNSGLAKGGSGDVLAGMIASLCAQGLQPLAAAACGVFLHGLAGDLCAQKLSQRGMLPTDVIKMLPEAFLKLGL